MHSLEMLQRMNSAKVVDRERRRAILMNNPGGHPKDAEKGRGTRRPEFRMLKLGEIVREGDEYDSVLFSEWRPVAVTIGRKIGKNNVGFYRRRLTTPAGE